MKYSVYMYNYTLYVQYCIYGVHLLTFHSHHLSWRAWCTCRSGQPPAMAPSPQTVWVDVDVHEGTAGAQSHSRSSAAPLLTSQAPQQQYPRECARWGALCVCVCGGGGGGAVTDGILSSRVMLCTFPFQLPPSLPEQETWTSCTMLTMPGTTTRDLCRRKGV